MVYSSSFSLTKATVVLAYHCDTRAGSHMAHCAEGAQPSAQPLCTTSAQTTAQPKPHKPKIETYLLGQTNDTPTVLYLYLVYGLVMFNFPNGFK